MKRRLEIPQRILAALLCVLGLLAGVSPSRAGDEQPITVYAAASLENAVEALIALAGEKGGPALKGVYASSSALARQIEQGAPADLYLSANQRWADYLADEGLLAPNSPHPLLTNRLVVIVPTGTPQKDNILSLMGDDGYLALADSDHVPAGIYAKEALSRMGLWPELQGRIAYSGNVRQTLAMVETGSADVGIVYATDAKISSRVDVAFAIPDAFQPDIRYTLSIVAGRDTPAVDSAAAFFLSSDAQKVFSRFGFLPANLAVTQN